jgi:hypothetical protein
MINVLMKELEFIEYFVGHIQDNDYIIFNTDKEHFEGYCCEITEDYLTFVVSMKKEYDDCKRIICLDSIKSFYDDENNRMLFSVDIK